MEQQNTETYGWDCKPQRLICLHSLCIVIQLKEHFHIILHLFKIEQDKENLKSIA
jgi:hypothetical protein